MNLAGSPSRAASAMRIAVDQLSDLIFVLTPDGRVVAHNESARAWVDLPDGEVVGQRLADLADRSAVLAANRDLFAGMPWILSKVSDSAKAFSEDEMTLFDSTGRLVSVSIRLDPVRVDDEALVTWTVRLLDDSRMIFRASTVAMARLSTDGRFLQANRALTDMVGITEEALAGTLFVDLVLAADQVEWHRATAALSGPHLAGIDSEQRLMAAAGQVVWTHVTRTALPGSHEIDGAQLVVVQDVTARRLAEVDAARSAADHRLLARLATTALAAPDADTLVRDVADMLCSGTGALAVEWSDGRADLERELDGALVMRPVAPGRWFTASLTGVGRDGVLRVKFASEPAADGSGARDAESGQMLTGAAADIVSAGLARVRAETALREQSLRDPLTGLANRRLLLDRLRDALERHQGLPGGVVVLFIDLDGFKAVNDTYGHDTGDRLLVEFAARLRRLVRSADLVCRWGGDEFVVMVQRLPRESDSAALARRIAEAAAAPFQVGDVQISVGASVGIGLSRDGTDAGQLVDEADESMYGVKRGRGSPT